jgi:hypothetical protein
MRKKIRAPKRAAAVTLREAQDMYAMQVLSLIYVAREIRKGRADELANTIEEALAGYLARISSFRETSLTTATYYTAGLLYKSAKKRIPRGLSKYISRAQRRIRAEVSEDCYELTTCTTVACVAGCVPWPTSLRPVDVNKPSPVGWHYILNSHCGFHWPKFWKLDCCEPIGITQCETYA